MKLRMYSIMDSAVGAFMRPIFARSDGEMARMFSDEVNRPESECGKHPEDYALMYVGEFNELTGVVTPCVPPHSMGLAQSYVARKALEAVS